MCIILTLGFYDDDNCDICGEVTGAMWTNDLHFVSECVMRTVPSSFSKNANALLGLDPRYLELRFINQATNPLALWTVYKH